LKNVLVDPKTKFVIEIVQDIKRTALRGK